MLPEEDICSRRVIPLWHPHIANTDPRWHRWCAAVVEAVGALWVYTDDRLASSTQNPNRRPLQPRKMCERTLGKSPGWKCGGSMRTVRLLSPPVHTSHRSETGRRRWRQSVGVWVGDVCVTSCQAANTVPFRRSMIKPSHRAIVRITQTRSRQFWLQE